ELLFDGFGLGFALAAPAEAILHLQRTYGNRSVQRLVMGTGETIQREPQPEAVEEQFAQRSSDAASLAGGPLDDDTNGRIQNARSGGQPLDHSVGAQLGAAMGADFSSVKVHTGTQADSLNRSLSAKAFTTGSDI